MAEILDNVMNGIAVVSLGAWYLFWVGAIATVLVGGAAQIYQTVKSQHPNPPVYRDVNRDRIEDKIIQRRLEKPGILWAKYYVLENDTLYGTDVNGKRLYLSREQLNGLENKTDSISQK